MNWKYTLNEDKEEQSSQQPQQIFITPAIGGMNGGMNSSEVRVVENTIFFYSDINNQSALDLNQALFEIDSKLKNASNFLGPEFKPHIKLKINSSGGSVFSALAVLDTIRSLTSEVHTYIEGGAASAATIISIAGAKRYIGKNSMMLIHQLSAEFGGKYVELIDSIDNAKQIMKIIKDTYKQYTKLPMKNIDEILKHDLWFDSAKCLEFGLVDKIL